MTINDRNLLDALRLLTPGQRKAVTDHLGGKWTDESWAIVRWLRRRLKRRVRAKKR